MRNAYSYQGILSAVGQVLDQAGVKRIAIEDTGDGLLIEGFDDAGQSQMSVRYDVPSLFDLIEAQPDTLAAQRMTSHDEGTLRHFLETHELVGAR